MVGIFARLEGDRVHARLERNQFGWVLMPSSLQRCTARAVRRTHVRVTAVFIFVEKKEGFFPNCDSTAVSFLLVLLAFD